MSSQVQEEKVMNFKNLERKGTTGKEDGAEVNPVQEKGVRDFTPPPQRNRPVYRHRDSLLPLKWKVAHTSRWKAQVIASVLSLIAFTLMLVMSFSQSWLYFSTIHFFQRWPANDKQIIYNSVHIMSQGPLQHCIFQSCPFTGDEEENLELWTDHLLFGIAKITFSLSLVLGFLYTLCLYLPYIPGLRRVPFFGLIGCIISFCEVILLFSSLLLFPMDVWFFEVKKNFSVHIGWSYFIGWVVFVMYIFCAFLCYFNNKKFWSLVLSSTSSNISYSSTRSNSLIGSQTHQSTGKKPGI